MKKIILAVVLLVTLALFFSLTNLQFNQDAMPPNINKPESWYSDNWCKSNGGESEVVLSDGTRADCVTENQAIEFDFTKKPYECTGQALHYANKTGKNPLCILIQREGTSMEKVSRAVQRVSVPVKCMSSLGVIVNCP